MKPVPHRLYPHSHAEGDGANPVEEYDRDSIEIAASRSTRTPRRSTRPRTRSPWTTQSVKGKPTVSSASHLIRQRERANEYLEIVERLKGLRERWHIRFLKDSAGHELSCPSASHLECSRPYLLARIVEGLRKAEEHNDVSRRLGLEVMALEEEIKAAGGPTIDQHKRLDDLYRENLKNADEEKRMHEEYDFANNVAILQSLTIPDEPPVRNNAPTKGSRSKVPRTSNEVDVVVDSPGPSPSETRTGPLSRVKATTQRSSSVSSTARSTIGVKPEEGPETNRGLIAEKAGQLIVGTEVFYKLPKGTPEDAGIGIQCIIKKVWQEKKPIAYDVQDPEPDSNGKVNIHKATARDLIPIPQSGALLPTFAIGANVFARYPETDTFYKAKVRALHKGFYTLKFEGEEDDKEMDVDKRFVLDSKLR